MFINKNYLDCFSTLNKYYTLFDAKNSFLPFNSILCGSRFYPHPQPLSEGEGSDGVIGFGFFPHPQPLSEGEGSDSVIGFGFKPLPQPLSEGEGSDVVIGIGFMSRYRIV